MARFKKPVFTREEVAELESYRLRVGYDGGSLIPGHDFDRKPFDDKGSAFANAKELLDGTAKKRRCHALINKFGWTRFDNKSLAFGIKFTSPNGLSKTGKSVIKKYEQWLGYLLEQAGWKNIRVNEDEYLASTDYIVPLDNPENIKLLRKLSPSMGFHYKTKRPDMDDLDRLEMLCGTKLNKTKQSHTR